MKQIKLSEVNYYCVYKDVIRNIWVMVLMAAICSLGYAFTAKYVEKPMYVSGVTFAVCNRDTTGLTFTAAIKSQNVTAPVLTDVMKSDSMKENIAKNLGNTSFNGSISASVIEGTNMLKVNVTAVSPQSAYLAACTVMNNYNKVTDFVFSNLMLEAIERPVIRTVQSNSTYSNSLAAIFGVAGGVLAFIIVICLSMMRDTVKTASEMENNLECDVFASIKHEKKPTSAKSVESADTADKGKKKNFLPLLITNPVISFAFCEEIDRIATKLEYVSRNKAYKTFMLTSVTENAGKTTISANTALALAGRGHKVLLVDGDFRKPSIKNIFTECNLNEDKQHSITDILSGNISLNEAIIKHPGGLSLLLEYKGHSNSLDYLTSEAMKWLLDTCKGMYDFVIVDSAPLALLIDAESLAQNVDATLMVVRQDTLSVQTINDAIENLNESGTELLGCIFNNSRSFAAFGKSNEYGYRYEHYYGRSH